MLMNLMLVRSINLNLVHQSELQLKMTHQSSKNSRRYTSVSKRDDYDEDHGDRRRNRSRSSTRRHRRSRSKSDKRRRRSSRSSSRNYSRSFKRRHRDRSRSKSRSERKRRHRTRTPPPLIKNCSPVRKNDVRKSLPREILKNSSSINQTTKSFGGIEVQSRQPDIDVNQKCVTFSSHDTAGETNKFQIEHVKLPEKPVENSKESLAVGAYYNLSIDEPVDKERIHREIEEKLRLELAKEGKVYPPPKAEASHPVFANDGSFLEIFKKMQEQIQIKPTAQIDDQPFPTISPVISSAQNTTRVLNSTVTPPPLPVLGRRRGGKILKTGIVAKPKALNESESGDPKDFWSVYLREVNKYKNAACETDGQTRPLVK